MRTKLAFLILLILTSCTPRLIPKPNPTQIELTSPPPGELQPTPAPAQGDTQNMTPLPSFPAAPNLQNLIEETKADLAQRLSISAEDIILVEAKAVTWSDGSLGCPQPDMMYTQALVPGYLVVLQYNDRVFEYHGGRRGSLFYCENPIPPVEGLDNT